jgi:hypothetical protein
LYFDLEVQVQLIRRKFEIKRCAVLKTYEAFHIRDGSIESIHNKMRRQSRARLQARREMRLKRSREAQPVACELGEEDFPVWDQGLITMPIRFSW